MKTDPIETLFKKFDGQFDTEIPADGHAQRFFDKLQSVEIQIVDKKPKRLFLKPFLAIAASILLCFGLFMLLQPKTNLNDLASVSPELSQTQDFFMTAITSELKKINDEKTSDNEMLISDALKQMELLEKNYENLKIDLKESGNDKRVIYAMISNFQSRIDLLENVLKTIENLKTLKPTTQQHHQTVL